MLNDDRLIMPRAQHALLWVLARNNGQILTWVELHHAIWPAEFFIAPDAMYAHLSRLRAQLTIGLALHNPALEVPIRTIVHVGVELRWPPDRLVLNQVQTNTDPTSPPPHPDPETP